jgi:hypothetical protein
MKPNEHARLLLFGLAVAAKTREGAKADDGLRTRDLRLGKPTLYQLSYVRAGWRF